MKTITCGSREAVVQAIKDLRLGEPTEIVWVRPSGSTTYRFGMDGWDESVRALANFGVISQEDINRAYPAVKPGLRTMMKEYRDRRRDHQTLEGLDQVALNAFERRKERIIKNLMRLPERMCN